MEKQVINAARRGSASTAGSLDWLVLGLVGLASFGVMAYLLYSGIFTVPLIAGQNWSWYVVRAAGMTSFLLLTASTLWGIFLSTHVIKDWAPGPLSLLLHATTSWLAIGLLAVHVGLLLLDKYYSYTVINLLIPFTGPYRVIPSALGIIAMWLLVAVMLSFSLRKRLGRRAWLWIHYTSYLAFALTVGHILFAGTDATARGMLGTLAIFTGLVGALFVWRVRQSSLARR